jgi:Tol biopolymer transport system component/DNA-binding winged helix-turn-helix (wHTH) protein
VIEKPNGFRFGVFELDLQTGELRRDGIKVRIQEQPLRVLSTLLERQGGIVTRDEFRAQLWPGDTFVEFDHSLNTAVNKAREALGDTSDSPRYIATIPRRGYRFIAPIQVVTNQVAENATAPAATPQPENAERTRTYGAILTVSAAMAAAVVVGIAGLLWFDRPESEAGVEKFTIVTAEPASSPVISPDGRHIAYICGEGDQARLCIQDFDRFEPRKIARASRVELHPFWSPDSSQLAFAAGRALWIVPIVGGEPAQACRLPGPFLGGAWNPNGDSVLIAVDHQGIFELRGLTGTPKLLIPIDRERWGLHFETPVFLPRRYGRVLLYSAQTRGHGHVAVLRDMQSGKTEIVAPNGSAAFSPTGHIVYPYDLDIWAAPVSPKTLKPAADPFPIGRSGPAFYPSVSSGGTLAYLQLDWHKRLAWLDRTGRPLWEDPGSGELILSFAPSPDGTRAAVTIWAEDTQTDIWVWDLVRGARTRLTFGPASEGDPVWNPTGEMIAYRSNQNGNPDIFQKAADGTGSAVPLVVSPRDETPERWSPDGKVLLYRVLDPKQNVDLWMLKAKEDGSGYISTPYLQTPFAEKGADLSPDGRFVAYSGNQSGRPEVYVQPFPAGRRVQVSVDGGSWPRWGKGGRELFYLAGDKLMRAPVHTNPVFSAGIPEEFFRSASTFPGIEETSSPYAPSADGQRFLVSRPARDDSRSRIRVVKNWFAEFRGRGVKQISE